MGAERLAEKVPAVRGTRDERAEGGHSGEKADSCVCWRRWRNERTVSKPWKLGDVAVVVEPRSAAVPAPRGSRLQKVSCGVCTTDYGRELVSKKFGGEG